MLKLQAELDRLQGMTCYIHLALMSYITTFMYLLLLPVVYRDSENVGVTIELSVIMAES